MKNITERYDGYGNSIRKVMEQKERNPGIHGVVADLFKTQKKYETALETALGGSIQNIVTDNESTAKYLIEFLKREGMDGQRSCLLTSMNRKQTFPNEAALKEPGVLGIASSLVEYEKRSTRGFAVSFRTDIGGGYHRSCNCSWPEVPAKPSDGYAGRRTLKSRWFYVGWCISE